MAMTRKRTHDAKKRTEVVDLVKQCIGENLLDGNGHGIYLESRYTDKLDAHKDEISLLCSVHTDAYNNDGSPGSPEGIWSLDFHYWVVRKILQVDSKFTYEEKIGRGFQAVCILNATKIWLSENGE